MEKENALAEVEERSPLGRRAVALFEQARPVRDVLSRLVALYDELDPSGAQEKRKAPGTVH